jgi:hypothetical protein
MDGRWPEELEPGEILKVGRVSVYRLQAAGTPIHGLYCVRRPVPNNAEYLDAGRGWISRNDWFGGANLGMFPDLATALDHLYVADLTAAP